MGLVAMLSLFVSAVAANEVCQNSIEELTTDLQQCGDASPDCSACDDADCNQGCMEVKNNGSCKIDAPGCARQVAYGGYVKSHVLIQCYGMIDEGCKVLPTKYMPMSYTQGKDNSGLTKQYKE